MRRDRLLLVPNITTYAPEREVSNLSGSSASSIQMILIFVEERPKKIGALVASLILVLLLELNVDCSK